MPRDGIPHQRVTGFALAVARQLSLRAVQSLCKGPSRFHDLDNDSIVSRLRYMTAPLVGFWVTNTAQWESMEANILSAENLQSIG